MPIACLLTLTLSLAAFPPAPAITYFGTVRDGFGNALDESAEAVMLVGRGSDVVAEAPIDPRLRPGENFRAEIRMDLDSGDAYREGALAVGDQITLSVELGAQILPVEGVSVATLQLGMPGERIYIDCFIGLDSDGDELPDNWELGQLELAGFGPSDPEYSLDSLGQNNDFDGDGTSDFDEYVAGTFALIQSDFLSLLYLEQTESADRFRTRFVFGKFYQLEQSLDLVTWGPVPIRLSGSQADPALELQAVTDAEVEIEVVRDSSSAPEKGFYRLRVR